LGGVAIYCALNTMPKDTTPMKLTDEYKADRAIVQMYNDATGKWCGAIYRIKTTESYLQEGLSWEKWCEKYCPWTTPKAIQNLIKYEAKTLPKHAGERIDKKSSTSEEFNKSKRGLASDNVTEELNKEMSTPPPHMKLEPVRGKSPKVFDEEGHAVPEHLVVAYHTRDESKRLISALADIRDQLASLRKSDRVWKKVSSVAESHIEQAIADIKDATPHTVCTECQGWFEQTKKGNCLACNSTGLMSKRQFQMADKLIQSMHKNETNRVSRLPD